MSADGHDPTILIIGGVAGGAAAAARARRMNEQARIVMIEKDAYVSFANCGLPYYLGGEITDRDKLLVATPELFARRFRIESRVRHEALAIDRGAKTVQIRDLTTGTTYDERYDKLILSPGAVPVVPPIRGSEADGVFALRTIADMDRIAAAMVRARHAVVVGAGYIGLEMAEQLHHKCLEVALVELQNQVMPLLDPEIAEPLHREIEAKGVRLELGRSVTAIETEAGRASAVTLSDGVTLLADLVLLAVGVRPQTALAAAAGLAVGPSGGIATGAHMQTSDPDIYAVGDAAEYAYGPTGQRQRVPLAGIASRTGRLAGEHAATGGARTAPAAWATSIVRVFDYAVGITGLSLAAARAQGLDANAAHIVSYHHASYYPGALPMAVKLVYERGRGRVLGAQAIGGAGVDKRLDVVATLLHFQGTVDDLASLDLAYAPPFGAVKDPLHMAAFAAQNDLDGLAPLLQPAVNLKGLQVVDVREPSEIEAQPLAGCSDVIAIRLDDLRERLGELDPAQLTVVSCRTGLRAYVAVRILAQHGFREVLNLSGAAAVRDFALNRRSGAAADSPERLPTPQYTLDFQGAQSAVATTTSA